MVSVQKSEGPKLLERVTFKLCWNKSTGRVCSLHIFIHIAESQVNLFPWIGTVGWWQVMAEKMTTWTKIQQAKPKTGKLYAIVNYS